MTNMDQASAAHESPNTSAGHHSPAPESQYGGGGGGGGGRRANSPSQWLDELPTAVRDRLVVTNAWEDFELEHETGHIMNYLDHVVPFFYPFYRPPLISGGRGWQLFLLLKEKTIFHTAISLTAYFLTVAFHSTRDRPALQRETHNACQSAAWADLLKHQELAIRTLQRDVAQLSKDSSLRDSIRGLQSIIQLLEFEVAIGKKTIADGSGGSESTSSSTSSSSWLPHLNAALQLFNQILERQRQQRGHEALPFTPPPPPQPFSFSTNGLYTQPQSTTTQQHPWHAITKQLSHAASPAYVPPTPNFRPPLANAESALHFYTARLLYIDIIAATTLDRVPLLEPHHAALLLPGGSSPSPSSFDQYGGDDEGQEPAINLAEHVGIENWALLATAQVTALSVWKTQMRAQGTLSIVELVRRAGAIEQGIRDNIARLAPVLAAGSSQQGNTSASTSATTTTSNQTPVPQPPPPRIVFDPSDSSSGGRHASIGSPSSFPTSMYPIIAPSPSSTTTTTTTSASSSSSSPSLSLMCPAVALHSTIHARATLIYLSSTVSGLQPSLPEIRTELAHLLHLFTRLPHASCLRTLLWAFTVAGCVTTNPDQRKVLESAVELEMGDMAVFGAAKEALGILRAVWRVRNCVGVALGDPSGNGNMEDWSLAACLNILGHQSLLA
ncbi:fungal-specific transcription factor domain-containing protein [Microdochium trichocladiopsis]|uniref:Fungal-specific transcription factor domain-containing protein n=1 Tax=Microdochium trichocladiopsis TaxID=1682393 RepID=A0A9P8YAQ3_9PEZI|nr:fungal-specific transcription factor domain-containing protein [Microdochium trichocladiopsis]KAH7034584.1 fungal-specific transcription factor domain-containing protein [Microdochium trichocladiopsis]